MAISTSRMQLAKPEGTDIVDYDLFLGNNFDKLDIHASPQMCTTSTRPPNPFAGKLIYETDIGALCMWEGNSWNQVNTTVKTAIVATSENLTGAGSNVFTDLATVGPSVTVYLHKLQQAKVTIEARMKVSTGGGGHSASIGWAVSGTETVTVDNDESAECLSSDDVMQVRVSIFRASNQDGNRTFTMKYRNNTTTDTSSFLRRRIIVEPMGLL